MLRKELSVIAGLVCLSLPDTAETCSQGSGILKDVAPASGLFPPNGSFFFSYLTAPSELTLSWEGGGVRQILREEWNEKFNLGVVDPGEPKPGETYAMKVRPLFGGLDREIVVQIAEHDDLEPPSFDGITEIDSDSRGSDDKPCGSKYQVYTLRARPATDDIGVAGYALFDVQPGGLQLVQSELIRDPKADVYLETYADSAVDESCFVLKAFDLAGNLSLEERSVCASLGCRCLGSHPTANSLGILALCLFVFGIRRKRPR